MATEERFSVESAPPAGMSTGTKLFLGCGIGCAVLCLLCCGAFGLLMWWGMSVLPKSVVHDPEAVARISQSIVEINVPAELKPESALDLQMPFTGQPLLKFATYEGESPELLLVGRFSGAFAQADEKQMQIQINEALQKNQGEKDDLKVRNTKTVEIPIRGKDVSFRIDEGDMGDKEIVRAIGIFSEKNSATMIMLQLDAKTHSTDDVEKILQSIK